MLLNTSSILMQVFLTKLLKIVIAKSEIKQKVETVYLTSIWQIKWKENRLRMEFVERENVSEITINGEQSGKGRERERERASKLISTST